MEAGQELGVIFNQQLSLTSKCNINHVMNIFKWPGLSLRLSKMSHTTMYTFHVHLKNMF